MQSVLIPACNDDATLHDFYMGCFHVFIKYTIREILILYNSTFTLYGLVLSEGKHISKIKVVGHHTFLQHTFYDFFFLYRQKREKRNCRN